MKSTEMNLFVVGIAGIINGINSKAIVLKANNRKLEKQV